ncbi:hypothetical protein P8452_48201 [Trifolium repens]|jgi:hypothetical protein|nr:hypothetical protein P8452_48201 [Trifolium repens]
MKKEKHIKKKNVAKKPILEEPLSLSVVDKEPAKYEFANGGTSFKEMIRFDEMCMNVNVLKWGMELIGESERLEFDRRWKKLKAQEAKLHLKRAELVEEQVDLILKGLQGSS